MTEMWLLPITNKKCMTSHQYTVTDNMVAMQIHIINVYYHAIYTTRNNK